jgi:trk system potassium uptake protein
MTSKLLDFLSLAAAALGILLQLVAGVWPLAGYAEWVQLASAGVFAVLTVDVIARLALSPQRTRHAIRRAPELAVPLVLAQALLGLPDTAALALLREAVLLGMLVSRSRTSPRLTTLLSTEPARLMFLSFLATILVGATLLTHPAATTAGRSTGLLDALFTATSATCVTGLTVQDTATHFTRFGQVVILALVQIGGLGIMTFSVSLAVLLRKPVDLNRRAAMQDMLDHDTLSGVRRLTVFIVALTLLAEFAGGVGLSVAWYGRCGGLASTVYHAFFHSVSAFCNAGFSTFSDNLMSFRGDAATNVIVCLLIVGGGLGFLVALDLLHAGRRRLRRHPTGCRVRTQTHIALRVTAILLVGGALLIYLFERHASFQDFPAAERLWASLFQSVTARTAGFNSCEIGQMSAPSLFAIVVLMFIGACPGSTGGGIKTTTVAVLWAAMFSAIRQRANVEICRRTVAAEVILKATAVLCVALALVVGFTLALLQVEQRPLLPVVFEVVSAFGTVGLSTGITPALTAGGKLLIIILMFFGRLGPLTLAYAFAQRSASDHYAYAEERIMIG